MKGKKIVAKKITKQISELQELINEIKNELCTLPDWLSQTQWMNSELEDALRQAQTNTKIACAIAERSALELKERASDTAQLIEDVMRFVEQKRDILMSEANEYTRNRQSRFRSKITSLFTASERKILARLNERYVTLMIRPVFPGILPVIPILRPRPAPPPKPQLKVELLQPQIQAYEYFEATGDAKITNVGNVSVELLLRGTRYSKGGMYLGTWAKFVDVTEPALLNPGEYCTVRHGIRPLPDTAGKEDLTDGWVIDRYTGEKLADVQMPFKVGATKAWIDCPSSLLLKAGQWNEAQFTVTNKGESKLKLKVGISHPSQNYGYTYEWYVDGLTNGDTTKELNPGEFETGTLHIKPPATPVDVGDYFVIWADEVTIKINLFNRLVAFWIVK